MIFVADHALSGRRAPARRRCEHLKRGRLARQSLGDSMSAHRYRHPLLVAERFEYLREAGLPEHEAILWSYTRTVRGSPDELAQVAADWYKVGMGYAEAVGWIRVVGKWGWATRTWVSAGYSPEQVRRLNAMSGNRRCIAAVVAEGLGLLHVLL